MKKNDNWKQTQKELWKKWVFMQFHLLLGLFMRGILLNAEIFNKWRRMWFGQYEENTIK